jgi:hypothetical protein
MRVANFLQPAEEVVVDSHSDIMASVLAPYQPPREVETDEEPEEIPRMSSAKALEAVETFRLYETGSGQEGGVDKCSTWAKKVVKTRQFQRLQQPTLDSFLG